MAPPSPEYAQMTIDRALWQNFGQKSDDMTFVEYEARTALLRAEAEYEKSRRERTK